MTNNKFATDGSEPKKIMTEIDKHELEWHWFKGNDAPAALLQSVCLFRSQVLFDAGFRKDFSEEGRLYGDISYADFESYHVVASHGSRILGCVRVTPSHVENVARSVLGASDYRDLLIHIEARWDRCLEINRLMIDANFRKLELGRTLMYASIALIETVLDRSEHTIIGSAGNCTRQTEFFLKHTDYERIPGIANRFAPAFNDDITFLQYKNPPYIKGNAEIAQFQSHFAKWKAVPYPKFTIGEPSVSLEVNRSARLA